MTDAAARHPLAPPERLYAKLRVSGGLSLIKVLSGLVVLLALLIGIQWSAPATAVATGEWNQGPAHEKGQGNLADLPLRSVSIKASNIHLALSDISDKYRLPIGLEVSPDDDLLKERDIVVKLDSGTLRDVLNSVAGQNPLYTWEIVDGVVNVFPKGGREPVLKALLETRVGDFRVSSGMSRFTFRENLTGSAEVKGVLAAFGVKSNNEIFVSRDMAKLGLSSPLDLSDVSVKAVLNQVIRDSETRYWIVNRDGPERQYLLLNL